MRRYWDRLRIALVASTTAGTLALYPAWEHHTLHVRSAVLSSDAAARTWEKRFEAGEGRRCIRSTIAAKVEHPLAIGHDWLVDFKCNTPAIYERIAAIYLVPFLGVLALLTAIGAAARTRYRHPLGE